MVRAPELRSSLLWATPTCPLSTEQRACKPCSRAGRVHSARELVRQGKCFKRTSTRCRSAVSLLIRSLKVMHCTLNSLQRKGMRAQISFRMRSFLSDRNTMCRAPWNVPVRHAAASRLCVFSSGSGRRVLNFFLKFRQQHAQAHDSYYYALNSLCTMTPQSPQSRDCSTACC